MSNSCLEFSDVIDKCQDNSLPFFNDIDFQNSLAAGDLPATDQPVFFYHTHFWKDVERRLHSYHSKNRIAKILLRERITGKCFADQPQADPPYLDYNAQTHGDFRYTENLVNVCGKNAVWFVGESSGSRYVKQVHCRKQWCPVCGGKGGVVHKSRIKSVISRVDVEKYNVRQFIFTIPENIRDKYKSREGLNQLFSMARSVVEKYFGEPYFDRRGHVKGYKMELPCISYMHIFGDQDEYGNTGIYKPHVNIHIFEDKSKKLKLDQALVDAMRILWGKKLARHNEGIDPEHVDIHYSFSIGAAKVMHRIKYMLRPWDRNHYYATTEDVKELLVKELLGFQYFRYWGALANCKYKDEMDMPEIIQQAESLVDERLIQTGTGAFDFESWATKLEYIDDGFYRIKGKNHEDEKEKQKREGQHLLLKTVPLLRRDC